MLCSCCHKYTKWLCKVTIGGQDLFPCPGCIKLPEDELKARTEAGIAKPLEIVRMYNQGKTFAEIGKHFGVSRQRVHQIYKKSHKKT